jgi:hypothetical protein
MSCTCCCDGARGHLPWAAPWRENSSCNTNWRHTTCTLTSTLKHEGSRSSTLTDNASIPSLQRDASVVTLSFRVLSVAIVYRNDGEEGKHSPEGHVLEYAHLRLLLFISVMSSATGSRSGVARYIAAGNILYMQVSDDALLPCPNKGRTSHQRAVVI